LVLSLARVSALLSTKFTKTVLSHAANYLQ